MLISQVPPVLSVPAMLTDKVQRITAVVRHQLGPGKGGQGGEVPGQALLHLRLQGAVLGISAGVAMHQDAKTLAGYADVPATGELRERLGRYKLRLRGAGRTERVDLAQGELVQICNFHRKEQAPAAHIADAENDFVGKFVLQTEVEVIGFLRTLRVQHRVQTCSKAGLQ